METKYEPTPPPKMAAHEERTRQPCGPGGVPWFGEEYRHLLAIAPGAGALTDPIDAFVVTADCNVTVLGADDPSGAAVGPFAVKAGTLYKIACIKVTAVSAGTLIGLFHRKPA